MIRNESHGNVSLDSLTFLNAVHRTQMEDDDDDNEVEDNMNDIMDDDDEEASEAAVAALESFDSDFISGVVHDPVSGGLMVQGHPDPPARNSHLRPKRHSLERRESNGVLERRPSSMFRRDSVSSSISNRQQQQDERIPYDYNPPSLHDIQRNMERMLLSGQPLGGTSSSDGMGRGQVSQPVNNSLFQHDLVLLGHAESGDFAIPVDQDDITEGTNSSYTIPSRSQLIHRPHNTTNCVRADPSGRMVSSVLGMFAAKDDDDDEEEDDSVRPISMSSYKKQPSCSRAGPTIPAPALTTTHLPKSHHPGNHRHGPYSPGSQPLSDDRDEKVVFTSHIADHDSRRHEIINVEDMEPIVHDLTMAEEDDGKYDENGLPIDHNKRVHLLEMEPAEDSPDPAVVPDPACFCLGYGFLDYWMSSSTAHHGQPGSAGRRVPSVRHLKLEGILEEGGIDLDDKPIKKALMKKEPMGLHGADSHRHHQLQQQAVDV